MAVIRCQACGKPNPDFLEACQFCDARLKPLTGMLTPSPDAAPPLAPMTPPPAPPAQPTNIIKCQACGKPNPAFLDTCQFCDARLKPMTAELRLPDDSPTAATEWLISTRAAPAETSPNALPDWLQAMEPSAAEAPLAMPEPEATSEVPDWMRAAEPAARAAEPAAPAAETPDWMRAAEPAAPAAEMPDWMRAAEPAASAADDDVPDWLRAMQTPAAGAAESSADIPDWMRAAEPASPPTAETPDWMQAAQTAAQAGEPAAPTADDDVPDWLRAMQAPAGAAAESSADIPDWMRAAEPASPPAAETPDWMRAAQTAAPAAEPAAPAAQPAESVPDVRRTPDVSEATGVSEATEADVPDWLRAMQAPAASEPPSPPAQPAAEDEMPDWLRAMSAASAESAPIPAASEPEPEDTDWLVSKRAAPPAQPAADVPDWLQAMETPAPLSAAESPASDEAEMPDWMRTSAPSTPAPAAETPASDLPDWMKAMGGAAAASSESLPDWMQSSGAASTPEPAPDQTDDGMPDWLKAMQASATTPDVPSGEQAPASDMPDWMTAMENAPTQAALPPVSADMALPDDAPDWLKAMQGTGELSALQSEAASSESPVPGTEAGGDWLSALRGSAADLEPLPIGETPAFPTSTESPIGGRPAASGLEEAALPSWLAAMKPIDVQAAPLDEEADTYEERVGVLAGMRGVLRAEPVVALPRKSTVQVHKLEVSADQTRQANVLAALVSTDVQARAVPKRRPALLPMVERWLVVLALLAAIALPLYGVPGLFPLPTTINPQTQAAFNTVNGLPVDKPALVVFDYDPAQSGELNPSALALVKHLLLRGVTVVGVSTRPAGAALGDALFDEAALSLAGTFSYTYGVNYISLGYLPGGPVGVAQFAADPQSAFASDFRDEHAEVWNTSALSGLSAQPGFSLANFGGLIVLAATPDSARTWIEQAHPQAAAVPMVAAVSAGVEPLVLPYAEGNAPSLSGIISGAPGATQYEAQAGFAHDTTAQSWTVLGGGLVLGALPLLILGNIVASIVSLVRRRQQRRR